MTPSMEPANTARIQPKSMARNTALNLIGQLVPMLIGLFSIPVLISNIGLDRFGLLSLVWIVIGYFTFFDLGLGRAIVKLIAEKIGEQREEEIPPIFWNALLIMTAMSVIGSVVLLILTPTLVTTVFKIPEGLHDEAVRSFYCLSASLVLVTITAGFRGVLEARQRFDFANLLHILMGASTFVGPLLVSFFTQDIFILVLMLLFVRVIVFIAHLWFVFSLYPELRNPRQIERAMIRRLFKFATWMTVSNVVSPIMVYFDRFILSAIVPVAQLAFYTTPYEIVTRLLVIPSAVVRTLFPTFALLGVDRELSVGVLFIRCVKLLLFVLFPTILLIVYFGEEGLRAWLGEAFALKSTTVLQILAIGIFLNGIAFLPMTLLQSAERPDLSAKLHLFEFPLYLPAVWIMASNYGIAGAAIAFTVRVSIDMIGLFIAARRVLHSLGKELTRLIWPLALTLLTLIPGFLHFTLTERIVTAVGILISFGFMFWAVVLHLEDRLIVLERARLKMPPLGTQKLNLPATGKEAGKVCAVVSVFNPTDEIVANIKTYISQVDHVFIIDNGSSSSAAWVLSGPWNEDSAKITIIRSQVHLGSAAAVNLGIRGASKRGAEWVVTFEQDNRVPPDYIATLLSTLDLVPQERNVGAVCPVYFNEATGREFSVSGKLNGVLWDEVKSVSLAGTIFKVAAISKVGLFEEKLFINYIDHEFALRLLGHGYVLIEARRARCVLHHGPMRIHGIKGLQFSAPHYNPVMRYYLSRNRLALYRRYFLLEPIWVARDLLIFVKEIVKILLVESEKWAKLLGVVRGVCHGVFFRFHSLEALPAANTTRIAIVLATYETPIGFFREQLESIRSQTDQNWICIITDDNSAPAKQEEIQAVAAEIFGLDDCGKARFAFRTNRGRKGVVGNFADGLTAVPVDCEFVCFSDQDDVWFPEKLAELRRALSAPGVSLVHSDLRLIDDIGREIHPSCWAFEGRDVNRTDPISLIMRNSVSGCAMMFRRDVIDFCLPFPDQPTTIPWFYHDAWIALGASFLGEISLVPKPLIGYRQHCRNVVGAEIGPGGPGWEENRNKSARSQQRREKTAWRSRAFLEEACFMRLTERRMFDLACGKGPIRFVRTFSVAWDFGLFPLLWAIKIGFFSPRNLRAGLLIAVDKFMHDFERVLSALGVRSTSSGKSH